MINFFRMIRQKWVSENKFSKYLLYAVGEIILVVIGILIALQINNWNEDRKKVDLMEAYRVKLIEELNADISWLSYLDSMNSIYSSQIIKHLHNNETLHKKEVLSAKQSRDNYSVAAFYSNTYTLNTLISTGDLSLFRNSEKQLIIELKANLEKYEFYEKSFIEAVSADFQKIKPSLDLASDYGYSIGAEKHEGDNQRLSDIQYQMYRNYLAETLYLYDRQTNMYARIRELSVVLMRHLKDGGS